MNELDSDRLAGYCLRSGWSRVERFADADLVILNTCSVREKAEEKFFTYLGTLKKWKELNPHRKIVAAGCVAQQWKAKIFRRAPQVDVIVGPSRIPSLMELLDNDGRSLATDLSRTLDYDDSTVEHSDASSAKVTIIEGCDRFCSFCIVPYTRGRERSRPSSRIIQEVQNLIGGGYLRVILLGQIINAYQCPETGMNFSHLLERVARLSGLESLNFITSHPVSFDARIAEVISNHPNISRYFHIPAQSGSNSVLKGMNRGYTREEYLCLTETLRKYVPDIALSSDFIVGFPGETEDDHADTLDLLQKVRFSSIYAFKYSTRPGTAAAKWKDSVSLEIKNRRLQEVLSLQKVIQLELNTGLVGKTLRTVIEEIPKNETQFVQGRTHCGRVVNIHTPRTDLLVGEWHQVRIISAHPHSLSGDLVDC